MAFPGEAEPASASTATRRPELAPRAGRIAPVRPRKPALLRDVADGGIKPSDLIVDPARRCGARRSTRPAASFGTTGVVGDRRRLLRRDPFTPRAPCRSRRGPGL